VLRSAPGCAEQAAHCDYVPTAALRAAAAAGAAPHFAVAALERGTRLVVWRGSHRLVHGAVGAAVARVDLALRPGDVAVVRGDTVHAGAAYAAENVRLHAFLDVAAVPRPANRTWRLDGDAPPAVAAAVLAPQ
jgi:hypothetical protein